MLGRTLSGTGIISVGGTVISGIMTGGAIIMPVGGASAEATGADIGVSGFVLEQAARQKVAAHIRSRGGLALAIGAGGP